MRQQVVGRGSYVLKSSTPQSSNPLLLCTAKYYSSPTWYYRALLQHHWGRHSTTNYTVLLVHYSAPQRKTPSTTLYHKVLLQNYFVLQRTAPVRIRTTKYESRTNLRSATLALFFAIPVLLCTTKYFSVLLQCHSVLSQYYSLPVQYYSHD